MTPFYFPLQPGPVAWPGYLMASALVVILDLVVTYGWLCPRGEKQREESWPHETVKPP